MSGRLRIFISSVQKEFSEERASLRDYLRGDPLFRRFCDLGLFGNEYGNEDAEGVSPTEREFELAGELSKPRFIFVRRSRTPGHPKMAALITRAGSQLIRRRFESLPELTSAVYACLVNYLEEIGLLRTAPFDAAAASNATVEDISPEKVEWFLKRAQYMRDYALSDQTPVADVLTHLNLLDRGIPNHAAILLFGKSPQRFLVSSELKCMHFHTPQKSKPIPSYQIYKGTVFDVVDQAIDFVMSKLNRSVGTRAAGPQAPVEYDIPEEVVAEGIVNAVAHHDYASNASVEVQLFPDRLEIWNPGTVHPPLTLEKLYHPHASQPNNPLIAEPLFLTKYIEKAGTGTVDMLERCRAAGMKQPEFSTDAGFFILTVWRKTAGIGSGLSRDQVAGEGTVQVTAQDEKLWDFALHDIARVFPTATAQVTAQVALFCREPKSAREIMEHLRFKHWKTFQTNYLNPLIQGELLERTIADKPTSRLQKYRLTDKGRTWLAGRET